MRDRDWKPPALWAALLLNLGLAGYLGIRAAEPTPKVQAVSTLQSGTPFYNLLEMDALDSQERDELRQSIRAALPDIRAKRQDAELELARFHASFRVESFDPEQSLEHLRAVSRARADQYETAGAVYIQLYEALSPDAKAEAIARRDARIAEEMEDAEAALN